MPTPKRTWKGECKLAVRSLFVLCTLNGTFCAGLTQEAFQRLVYGYTKFTDPAQLVQFKNKMLRVDLADPAEPGKRIYYIGGLILEAASTHVCVLSVINHRTYSIQLSGDDVFWVNTR
ncbi:MAG: hypothetical protein EOO38_28000 [Cytophagaceae bacterium]|nr:MAG: hypothetical protein EOO38_28000 [Cytophagaceae bacterium]